MKKRIQSKPSKKKKAYQVQQNTAQQSSSISARFDWLKWTSVFIILIVSIVANYYYSEVSWAIRASIGIDIVGLLGFILYYTQKGQVAFGFIKAARTELRKVVWPTRQETIRTTFLVIGIVVLAGVVLWALDSLFIWGVTRIMSIR